MEHQWFNDSEFWERFAPVMFDAFHWAEVPLVADALTSLAAPDLYVETAGPVRCLDQCCGFGRISLEMGRRGFAVTGVDITTSYLETGADDAAHEGLDIEFIQSDVRLFRRKNSFDMVYNVYTSFGYFESPEDDALVVRNAFDSLKSGGTFVVETLGKEIAVRDFVEAEWFERAGYFVLTSYECVDSWAALKNRWILINRQDRDDGQKRGDIVEKTFTQRLYSASELRGLLRSAGFERVELYGGWNQEPYDGKARTLIAAGKKPLMY